MLDRSPRPVCVECSLPLEALTFTWQRGLQGMGPAYWSDRGVLCSVACVVAHVAKRRADGTEMREPAPEPNLARQ